MEMQSSRFWFCWSIHSGQHAIRKTNIKYKMHDIWDVHSLSLSVPVRLSGGSHHAPDVAGGSVPETRRDGFQANWDTAQTYQTGAVFTVDAQNRPISKSNGSSQEAFAQETSEFHWTILFLHAESNPHQPPLVQDAPAHLYTFGPLFSAWKIEKKKNPWKCTEKFSWKRRTPTFERHLRLLADSEYHFGLFASIVPPERHHFECVLFQPTFRGCWRETENLGSGFDLDFLVQVSDNLSKRKPWWPEAWRNVSRFAFVLFCKDFIPVSVCCLKWIRVNLELNKQNLAENCRKKESLHITTLSKSSV